MSWCRLLGKLASQSHKQEIPFWMLVYTNGIQNASMLHIILLKSTALQLKRKDILITWNHNMAFVLVYAILFFNCFFSKTVELPFNSISAKSYCSPTGSRGIFQITHLLTITNWLRSQNSFPSSKFEMCLRPKRIILF